MTTTNVADVTCYNRADVVRVPAYWLTALAEAHENHDLVALRTLMDAAQVLDTEAPESGICPFEGEVETWAINKWERRWACPMCDAVTSVLGDQFT